MLFVHPNLLWLLWLAPAMGVIAWRSGGARRAALTTLRTTATLAAVAALCRPLVGRPDTSARRVTAVEYGGSGDLPATQDDVTTIAFANRARRVTKGAAVSRDAFARPLWPDDTPRHGVNLAAALRLAGACVPAGLAGTVTLAATGLSDHGDAEAEAWRLAERGVRVETTPLALATAAPPPVRVRAVTLPARARVGQTLACDVELESTVSGRAAVRVTAGANAPTKAAVDLRPGRQNVTVPLTLTERGLTAVRVGVTPDGATPPDQDDVAAASDVAPAASVLLVQSAPGRAEAWSGLLATGFDVRAVGLDDVTPPTVDAADVIILDDVPAARLSPDAQRLVIDAVRAGTGLLVTGDTRAFESGGPEDPALASLLPVTTPQPAEQVDPSVAVVFIIDTSGSMQGERIDLAKEIARLALAHLSPDDRAGIVEFFGGRRWAAPLQPARNAAVLARALNRLTAAGGTTLYPAVEEAAFALRNVAARGKHVLVLSDGFVEDAPFAGLVRRMSEDGVVVSAVQVGPAVKGLPNMLPDLARWGGGRLYKVPDEQVLPDIRFKNPQASPLSPVVRAPAAVLGGDDALVRAVAAPAWPSVTEYVRTRARPTADVLLRTAEGDPLLARWRAGAGLTAALPLRLGSTSVAPLRSGLPFVRLVRGLVRQLAGDRVGPLRLGTTVRPAGLEVDVTQERAGSATGGMPLTLALLDAAGRTLRTDTAEPIADGHWNVLLPGVTAGVYRLHAAIGQTGVDAWAGVAVPKPPSATQPTGDRALLDRIAAYAPHADERARQLHGVRLTYVELRPALSVIAVVLLLTHVAVRRWPTPVIGRYRR